MSLCEQWCPTSVQVTVLQARGLRSKGKSGTNDAYAVMQVGKERYQTSVVEKSVAPVWKEEAAFDLPQSGGGSTERSTLHVHVLHRALVGPDKLLGQAVINLQQLSEDKTREKTQWFKLLDKTGKADKDRGEVLVDIQFMRNNMTASMFDLSAAGKSRSRLGKFKDKVRGKKKESDAVSIPVPSFSQVLTDSEEEEGNGDGEVAVGKDLKKKKKKIKSLFSPKSNLQRNMSQSMSVLPAKNFSLSGSQSSGLNVDPSEGKKKFKFKIHKRSGSSDSKDSSSHLKYGAAEQSNMCINGSHIYCDEPPSRNSRIGSDFSLASSGHGSMEDVPEIFAPSVDSLKVVRQCSPWEEEEEETSEANIKEEEEGTGMEEKSSRKDREEEDWLAEEERTQERTRIQEEEKRAEEERIRMEEKRAQEVRRQEEERTLADEKKRKEEEQRTRNEEKVKKERKRREEEERAQEERRRQEEEEMARSQEELRRLAEEKRRIEEEERRRVEEEKAKKEEERILKEEEERAQEERRRQEEEEMARSQEELRRLAEEKRTIEEEERRVEEEKAKKEEQRILREEEQRAQEERRQQEEEEIARRLEELRRLAEEKKRIEEEERRRVEEEIAKKEEERILREEEERAQEERRRQEEECKRLAEEKMRLEIEERKRIEKEEESQREEEERIRMEERRRQEEEHILAEEKMRLEEERRREEETARKEKEERIQREEEAKAREEEMMRRQEERQEKMRLVEQERRQKEQEEKKKKEDEEKALREKEECQRLEEEKMKLKEKEKERIEAEEKIRKEKEERIRVIQEEEKKNEEERRTLEKQERMRIEEEEKRQREEEEIIRKEEEEKARKEREDYERSVQEERSGKAEEEAMKLDKEKLTQKTGEQQRTRNKTIPTITGMKSVEDSSYNPFDEILDNPNSPAEHHSNAAGPSNVQQRCHPAASLLRSRIASSEEKDAISTQRERRPAPQPPGRNQAQSQREPEASVQHLAQINQQSADVKSISVDPQRSVQMIAPLGRSPTEAKNTWSLTQSSPAKGTIIEAKHSKGPAPSRPGSVEKGASSGPKTASSSDGEIADKHSLETKQEPTVCSLNPFEDDKDDVEQDDVTTNVGSIRWPPAGSQAADKDAASQAKIRSSKKARAPPLPANTAAVPSTSVIQDAAGGLDAGVTARDNSMTHPCDPKRVPESPVQESQLATVQSPVEKAGGKKEGPPPTSRRLQPVKPLNPLGQLPVSVVQGEIDNKSTRLFGEIHEKTKVDDAGVKGPYSQLTRAELISLLLKQENQLSERDRKISELEQYIDNLLVRVIEEKPSILMSMSALMKTV